MSKGLRDVYRWSSLGGVVLLATLLSGCPDRVLPPKTPPGPPTPDAPRVPAPKVSLQTDASPGKTALTVVPPAGLDCTLKRPPCASTR